MRRNPRAKWTLPDVVSPETSVCFVVHVPNNIFHIGAFLGAIQALASAASWQDDAAHTALDVAAVWRAIADQLEKQNCGEVNVQFRQPDLCTLEASFDGGSTWATIFTAATCADATTRDLVAGWIEDGTLTGTLITLYNVGTGPVGIESIGYLKWHVTVGADPEHEFVPYICELHYGRKFPTPLTSQCVRYKYSNFVHGWEDDPDPNEGVFTCITLDCDDVSTSYHHTNPFNQTEDQCWKAVYARSNNVMEFDVEIVLDCP